MWRILLLLLVVAVILALLFLRNNNQSLRQSGWLKAGGVLGVLILISRLFSVPLATLLYYLPFMIPSFRQEAGEAQQPAKHTGPMTRKEAGLILGVREGASEQEIKDAHKKLISRNHPDRGGSQYLAAKINEARDVLLK